MKHKFYVGVDVGGTKIAAAVVSTKGELLSRAKIPTPSHCKPSALEKLIHDIIAIVLTESGLAKQNILGIGIGVPGIVNKHFHILATPNINLAGYPLSTKLKKKYKAKIAIGNDVNLGLLGEQWLGAGKKAHNIVGIFPGTGVGGAIIVNHHLLLGTQGAAAEIGHMIMSIDGPLCHCGNHGCLEAYAGRWAIERDIRAGLQHKRTSVLGQFINNKTKTIKSKYLKLGIAKKDPLTLEVMTQMAKTLGLACINIRHIVNPELIILGGGVVEACGDFLLPIINQVSRSDPFFCKVDNCKIVTSKLGDDAVILGAVALVR